ncbi:nucleotide pyrophosphatase [Schizosaccharomyces japonicus yFS275]|uniref:Nucleotide pyrophosphatase n=1 Tax=Schizosaccharomyces japonicus (strain yFS275 / FY16936) TaxID=402676 RepID=B6JWD1_SCHJY|nr:nucleotide pyrophosphatase [Schizosaccharomyces japonicus yFS275]EEB05682.1 nucleotide pyrophosphatase [Schizosaccharomyces japonicus yFS275]
MLSIFRLFGNYGIPNVHHQRRDAHWYLGRFYFACVALVIGCGYWLCSRFTTTLLYFPFRGEVLSNGTNTFKPTVLLVSFDGFRADYLYRNLTPTLFNISQNGIQAPYLIPSFPTMTFPNHYTLVTGDYPEVHGIVSNNFHDGSSDKDFVNTRPDCNHDPEWWSHSEPIWINAERNGIRSAVHMWPGSEVENNGLKPTFYTPYNGSMGLDRKFQDVINWLDLPDETRPQLLLLYIPHIDSVGHAFGPESFELNSTLRIVDDSLSTFLHEVYQKRNLKEILNIVFVSDHGMAPTSNSRLIWMDDVMNISQVQYRDGWPLAGYRGFDNEDDIGIATDLRKNAPSNGYPWSYYSRETMLERWHYSANDRIAPNWIVPQPGWSVVSSLDHSPEIDYDPKGVHGYDNRSPLMRALFVASGPSFHKLHPRQQLSPFANVEIYNLLCRILSIQPKINNGSLPGALPIAQGKYSDIGSLLLSDVLDAYSRM